MGRYDDALMALISTFVESAPHNLLTPNIYHELPEYSASTTPALHHYFITASSSRPTALKFLLTFLGHAGLNGTAMSII